LKPMSPIFGIRKPHIWSQSPYLELKLESRSLIFGARSLVFGIKKSRTPYLDPTTT
jgi:hypothetical protein